MEDKQCSSDDRQLVLFIGPFSETVGKIERDSLFEGVDCACVKDVSEMGNWKTGKRPVLVVVPNPRFASTVRQHDLLAEANMMVLSSEPHYEIIDKIKNELTHSSNS